MLQHIIKILFECLMSIYKCSNLQDWYNEGGGHKCITVIWWSMLGDWVEIEGMEEEYRWNKNKKVPLRDFLFQLHLTIVGQSMLMPVLMIQHVRFAMMDFFLLHLIVVSNTYLYLIPLLWFRQHVRYICAICTASDRGSDLMFLLKPSLCNENERKWHYWFRLLDLFCKSYFVSVLFINFFSIY